MNLKGGLFLIGILLQISCNKGNEPAGSRAVNTQDTEATGPYFTLDQKGDAVLCWTERKVGEEPFSLKYAAFNKQAGSFSAVNTVPGSSGINTTAESMGKVAFKADGSLIAVFGKPFKNEKSPYAGAIYYTQSMDKGKNWTTVKFLHTDTAHTYGRSFFDVATMKNGEVAAVWLDGRHGKAFKGSALYFSATQKGVGFGTDTCLEKGTCECCRTDLLKDGKGDLHLAYRSIMYPSALLGDEVRDMAYKTSRNNGQTFSQAKTISNDNWKIDGCPHSGPSLSAGKNGVSAIWFTAGGSPGLYYTQNISSDGEFKKRTPVTASGKHPQMIQLSDQVTAIVSEESAAAEPAMPAKMNHGSGGMAMQHAAVGKSKITLRLLRNGKQFKELDITDGAEADHHAVLTKVDQGLLLAWVRETGGKTAVMYQYQDLNALTK